MGYGGKILLGLVQSWGGGRMEEDRQGGRRAGGGLQVQSGLIILFYFYYLNMGKKPFPVYIMDKNIQKRDARNTIINT